MPIGGLERTLLDFLVRTPQQATGYSFKNKNTVPDLKNRSVSNAFFFDIWVGVILRLKCTTNLRKWGIHLTQVTPLSSVPHRQAGDTKQERLQRLAA